MTSECPVCGLGCIGCGFSGATTALEAIVEELKRLAREESEDDVS